MFCSSLDESLTCVCCIDDWPRKLSSETDLNAHHPIMQSGDGPDIILVEVDKPPIELKERWKVAEKMHMIPQYAFAGDFTGEMNIGRKEVIDRRATY